MRLIIKEKTRGPKRPHVLDSTGSQQSLPPGDPAANWKAQEIVVVWWQIDMTEPQIAINQAKSGIYGKSFLTNGIATFVLDLRDGKIGPSNTRLYDYSKAKPTHFGIQNSCYIVFALDEDALPIGSSPTPSKAIWQFARGVPGFTTVRTPYKKYAGLWHVPAKGSTLMSENNGRKNGCKISFFSAYVDPSDQSTNPFCVATEYGPRLIPKVFDPDIKDDGHPDLCYQGFLLASGKRKTRGGKAKK